MNHLFELFPTPVLWCSGLIPLPIIDSLSNEIIVLNMHRNANSNELRHTSILSDKNSEVIKDLSALIIPEITRLGVSLFGEELEWRIKEIWFNVMDQGGSQSVHNHANSFISGIIYLTPSHASANTIFYKNLGGRDFVISNSNERILTGATNAEKWICPTPHPGDMALFPSFLMHEVPVNRGARRVTIAFNAIPTRLDSWGYSLNMT